MLMNISGVASYALQRAHVPVMSFVRLQTKGG